MSLSLEFTPLEFETDKWTILWTLYKILEFTPLEFETVYCVVAGFSKDRLEFTPLEFETGIKLLKSVSLILD